jgi:hypothetical protein
MTTIAKAVKRSIVSLKLPTNTASLIETATALVASLTNNPNFSTPETVPNPPLPTITNAATALATAQTAVNARAHGAVASRNEKRQALRTLLEQTKAHIQKVADGNADTAEAVIKSSGLAVRKAVIRQKQVFAVTEGPVSGSVKLETATVGSRASYEWQYSLDGGKTWLVLRSTLQAKTSMQGLTPLTSVSFRSRAVTKAGEGDWTQPLSITIK